VEWEDDRVVIVLVGPARMGPVSTRMLLVLSAITAFVILAAFAAQVVLAK
jgi:hypothetical protein